MFEVGLTSDVHSHVDIPAPTMHRMFLPAGMQQRHLTQIDRS